MKQSKRLRPVCDFKKRQEQEAAEKLAKASQELAQHQQRLVDLNSYRSEYNRKFVANGSDGMSAQKLREYQRFMHSLNLAIEQQKSVIEKLKFDHERMKRQWLAARNRAKAVGNVQSQYEHREQVEEDKKLQKEQDDRNLRRLTN